MSGDEPTIFVVEDNRAVRNSLEELLGSVGYQVEAYSSGEAFFDHYHPGRSGCLILDIQIPGMTGLEIQEQLMKREVSLPVIIISGHGDVPMVVRAMKNGAIDFLEKPFGENTLLQSVRKGLQSDAEERKAQSERSRVATRLAQLNREEQRVMEMLCEGMSNKEMAKELELGIKPLEAIRARLMEKMEVRSLAELVKTAVIAGRVS